MDTNLFCLAMEPEAKYTIVGIGILLISALLVFVALWLDNSENEGDFRLYTIYFKHHSLSGLQVDSDVTMRGIKIGSVKNWMISPNDIELVQVTVRVRHDTPVRTDTKAVINRNLLTGLANIDLIGSSQGANALTEIKPGEFHPVIPEGETELEAIKNTLPELLDNLNQMVAKASVFFSDANQKALTDTLSNLQSISSKLESGDGDIGKTLENLAKFSEELSTMGTNLNSKTEEVSRALAAAADTVTREAASIAQDITLGSKNLSNTLENYENPRAALIGPDSASLGPGENK